MPFIIVEVVFFFILSLSRSSFVLFQLSLSLPYFALVFRLIEYGNFFHTFLLLLLGKKEIERESYRQRTKEIMLLMQANIECKWVGATIQYSMPERKRRRTVTMENKKKDDNTLRETAKRKENMQCNRTI